jgi:hypothetical protein
MANVFWETKIGDQVFALKFRFLVLAVAVPLQWLLFERHKGVCTDVRKNIDMAELDLKVHYSIFAQKDSKSIVKFWVQQMVCRRPTATF